MKGVFIDLTVAYPEGDTFFSTLTYMDWTCAFDAAIPMGQGILVGPSRLNVCKLLHVGGSEATMTMDVWPGFLHSVQSEGLDTTKFAGKLRELKRNGDASSIATRMDMKTPGNLSVRLEVQIDKLEQFTMPDLRAAALAAGVAGADVKGVVS